MIMPSCRLSIYGVGQIPVHQNQKLSPLQSPFSARALARAGSGGRSPSWRTWWRRCPPPGADPPPASAAAAPTPGVPAAPWAAAAWWRSARSRAARPRSPRAAALTSACRGRGAACRRWRAGARAAPCTRPRPGAGGRPGAGRAHCTPPAAGGIETWLSIIQLKTT